MIVGVCVRIETLHHPKEDCEYQKNIESMVKALKMGRRLPIVHCVKIDGRIKALEGTRRLHAYCIVKNKPRIKIIDYFENKDTPILDIIDYTDGLNKFTKEDTVESVLGTQGHSGVFLEFNQD